MHEDLTAALRFLAGAGVVILVSGLCWIVVRAARHGGKGVRAAGAMLMLFGWGNMRDPANDPVKEAQDGHVRKGETSGDPLDPLDPPDPPDASSRP